jgi:hypothetical protein
MAWQTHGQPNTWAVQPKASLAHLTNSPAHDQPSPWPAFPDNCHPSNSQPIAAHGLPMQWLEQCLASPWPGPRMSSPAHGQLSSWPAQPMACLGRPSSWPALPTAACGLPNTLPDRAQPGPMPALDMCRTARGQPRPWPAHHNESPWQAHTGP